MYFFTMLIISSLVASCLPEYEPGSPQTYGVTNLKLSTNSHRSVTVIENQTQEAKDYLNAHVFEPEKFHEAGVKLEEKVTDVVKTFLHSQAPFSKKMERAVTRLQDPELLKNTGVFMTTVDSIKILESVAELENHPEYTQLFKDCRQMEPFRDTMNPSQFMSGIEVRVSKPIVNNGSPLFSEENKWIAYFYLTCLTEEILHAAQVLQGEIQEIRQDTFRNFLISDYFEKYDIYSIPFTMGGNKDLRTFSELDNLIKMYREADVYAKMVEIFNGHEALPEFFESDLYFYRQELCPKSLVLASKPPKGYERTSR